METNSLTDIDVEKPANTGRSPIAGYYMYTGYVLLALSVVTFVIFDYADLRRSDAFSIFIVHYFFALVYAGMLLYKGAFGIRKSWRRWHINATIIVLNLFLVSAYALNRELPVFQDSPGWFCAYLVITSLTLLSYQYFDALPVWVNRIQHLVLGSAFVLYAYLTLFVSEFYPVGFIGTIFFGIGAHIFVPLTLLIACIFTLLYSSRKKPVLYRWAIGGAVFTILFCVGFVSEWSRRVERIEKLINQSVLYDDAELPAWVKVAQPVPDDWITQRILKSDLVYTTYKDRLNWDFMPANTSWDEAKKHDPLVFLASTRTTCSLAAEDRVKVLQAISGSRHKANERLWSGDNLTTSYVVSDIDIYPDLRLAYTEKYLSIRNNAGKRRRWGNTQEAIYTFQLQEGSVVTSLSLWIDGKEEKGILTSKQKASKAYKTIVGVEQRDPSVIHWQEGNTVTVRVFPCTDDEERKVKIGITSPLAESNGTILYKNITFLGPDPHDARETIRVRFIGQAPEVEMPPGFRKDKNGDYVLEGDYHEMFQLPISVVPLRTGNRFTSNGFSYSISPYAPVYQPRLIDHVYLDLNNSWRGSDVDGLQALLSEKALFVYHDGAFIRLSEENWHLTGELRERNFSVFPFHLLKDTAHVLVVTKGKPLSPHLSDFKDSGFAAATGKFFAAGKKVAVYNIGEEVSTYIASLRELRALEFAQGSTAQLASLLKENRYPPTIENEEAVVVHDANIVISKKKVSGNASVNNAPDHLARLFAYNNIMRKVGVSYFDGDFVNKALVDEASYAHVVSPVSSLIVLESQEDYKRFDISDTENSLHNASKQSSGAVPEPHEWALIILFVLFVIYVKVRHSKLRMA